MDANLWPKVYTCPICKTKTNASICTRHYTKENRAMWKTKKFKTETEARAFMRKPGIQATLIFINQSSPSAYGYAVEYRKLRTL